VSVRHGARRPPAAITTTQRMARWAARAMVPAAVLGNAGCYLLGLWLLPGVWPDGIPVIADAWRIVTVLTLTTMQGLWLGWMYRQPIGVVLGSLGLWVSAIFVGGWEHVAILPGVLLALFIYSAEHPGRARFLVVALGFLAAWGGMLTSHAFATVPKAAAASMEVAEWHGTPVLVLTGILAALGTVAPALLGAWYAQLRDHTDQVADLVQTVTNGEVGRIVGAVSAERRLLATELHDVSSATITSLLMLTRLATEDAEDTDAPPAVRDRIGEIQGEARSLAEEYRRMVQVLQQADRTTTTTYQVGRWLGQNGTRDLPGLIGDLVAAGTRIAFRHDPDLDTIDRRLGPLRAHTAFRVVQEALNNARKHATDAPVTVTVSDDVAGLTLRIENGRAAPPTWDGQTPRLSLGMGIDGVRDRVLSVGGTLRAGPSHTGGWVVQALVPHPPTMFPAAARDLAPRTSRTTLPETGHRLRADARRADREGQLKGDPT
jgi:signal transduction histidine kinase